MAKRLVRAESVSTGENFLSPGQAMSSGDCSGGSILPPPRSSAQPLVPMEARSAGRSAGRTGDEILSPVSAISSGTGKRTGRSPGKVSSKTSSSARVTYKKRGPRQGKVPTPGPTAHSVPADDPSAPSPVAVATGAGGGLLGPAVGASLAHSPVLIASHAGQSSPGLASLPQPSTGSDFFGPSGVPMTPGSTGLSSESARSRSRVRGKKRGRSSHRSSSSSGSSARSHTGKKRRSHGSVSRAEFLYAVQSITASVSAMSAYHPGGLPGQLGPACPLLPGLYPDPGWATQSYVGPPHTVCRAPASQPALSLHPSVEFSVEVVGPPAVAAPVPPVGPSAPGDSAQSPVSTRPSQSGSEDEDEDESVHMQRLSVMETELCLVQRDMERVLQLPSLGETAGSSRQSFKHMTSSVASSTPVFPVLPLDLVCVERMNSIAETVKWSPYKKRELSYYRFPTADFTQFFTAPVVPDSAKDKLAADGGSSSAKNLFSDRSRGKLEDTLKKVDTASRLGLRASSFLLLLTEYLALGCEEDSPVPADLFTAALHCLDHGLRTSLDQFSRISTLAVTARRANVLDALFLPSEGARKRIQALPLLGPDLFAGKFQESMEAEAKRLEATEKINLNKPSQPAPKSARKVDKATFKIPRRNPLKAARGDFRGRSGDRGTRSARGQSYTGGQQPQPGRGSHTPGPAIPGAGASDALRHFSGSWARFTSNRWVLETVSCGYALEFTSTPPPPVGHVRSSDSHPVGRIETPHSRKISQGTSRRQTFLLPTWSPFQRWTRISFGAQSGRSSGTSTAPNRFGPNINNCLLLRSPLSSQRLGTLLHAGWLQLSARPWVSGRRRITRPSEPMTSAQRRRHGPTLRASLWQISSRRLAGSRPTPFRSVTSRMSSRPRVELAGQYWVRRRLRPDVTSLLCGRHYENGEYPFSIVFAQWFWLLPLFWRISLSLGASHPTYHHFRWSGFGWGPSTMAFCLVVMQ